jgi:dihydroorotate dehydrogenase
MNGYYLLRRLLFKIDPERVHSMTLNLLAFAGNLLPVQALLRKVFVYSAPGLTVNAFGLEFPNPMGLAAGYDKDGIGMHGLACLGFGHLELGTVTPLPQSGNPKPRIFRLPEDQAIINRMGFPNAGGEALLARLKKRQPSGAIIGVNIGKGADTPLEEAVQDYKSLQRSFYPYADYLVINVSSPNTIGLRRLQAKTHLEKLLTELAAERQAIQSSTSRFVPLLVKLAPDLTHAELEDAIQVITDKGLDGVIATNTTLAREGLKSECQNEVGGLSGTPLRDRAKGVVSHIHKITNGKLPIIGVGGIFGPDDAKAMLDAGASLFQIYTGLVYRGPGLVKTILKEIARENETLI